MNDLTKSQNANVFFENVAQIIGKARRFVGRTADVTMCVTYFENFANNVYEIGRRNPQEAGGD